MGRAASRKAAAVSSQRTRQHFQLVMGSASKPAPAYGDALLKGLPSVRALAEREQLRSQIRAGELKETLAVLSRVDGDIPSVYAYDLANGLAGVYAQRSHEHWELTAAQAMYDFGLAVVQSPLALPARLDEISQPLWEKHCVKGLGRVVERELNGGHGLTEERLVKQAASACRSGLILAVASQCKRAPLEHLRQLLGNELDGLTGQVAGGGRRRELPELAELFSVAHWAAVVGAWIPSTPLNEAEFADTRQSDNTVAVRENLFGEFINMLSSTWPQGN